MYFDHYAQHTCADGTIIHVVKLSEQVLRDRLLLESHISEIERGTDLFPIAIVSLDAGNEEIVWVNAPTSHQVSVQTLHRLHTAPIKFAAVP